MTAAEQGLGKNLRSAPKVSARSEALRRVERRNAHLALLTARASAPKEMPAIIGILLFAGSSRRATVQTVRSVASYIHPRKEILLLPHQSRKPKKTKLRLRLSLRLRARYFFVFLRLPVPATKTPEFVPSRTLPDGSVEFTTKEEIEFYEE